MAKKKIFISHSAHRDPTARPALDAIEERLKALDQDYSILLDHSTLKPGEDWRPKINLWCGGCDAAILLVTPDSVDSPYCVYEWSILSYRKATSDEFQILPIYHLGATPEDLRGKPQQIAEIQGVKKSLQYSEIDAVWHDIEEWLQSVAPTDTPSVVQAKIIANLFRDKDPKYYETAEALKQIKLELGTWEPLQDQWVQFAFLLLGLGLSNAAPALKQLQGTFGQYPEDWLNLIELVACAWVDHCSAGTFRALAQDTYEKRTVGLNAEQSQTAQSYVFKASNRRPSHTWTRVDVSDVVASLEELENKIADSLARALKLSTPADRAKLDKKLQIYDRNNDPVVIYLRTRGLSQEWLSHLRKQFRSVTFFLLTGNDQPAFENMTWLEPGLEANFEARFWNDYEDTKDFLLT